MSDSFSYATHASPLFRFSNIRKYSNASVCEPKITNTAISVAYFLFNMPAAWIKFNFDSFLHWNGRWMLTWSSNLQEKKPYNALSPKKKPISIWPSRSISAMTCNNNNNSEYTKIAFRRKHFGPKNIFFHFARIEFCPCPFWQIISSD